MGLIEGNVSIWKIGFYKDYMTKDIHKTCGGVETFIDTLIERVA